MVELAVTRRRPRLGTQIRRALWLSLALLALRLNTAQGLSFGDSEALYVSYSLHPQPAYLDHPGLIGFLLRVVGMGGVPAAETAHALSALLATLVPWVGALAARASGQSWEQSALVVLALALVPELSIGLFGVTPDLLLAVCWLAALAVSLHLATRAREAPRSFSVLLAWLGLGLLLGLGTLAKLSMGLLAVALLVASLSPRLRFVWSSYGPWCSLICAGILVAPLIAWEVGRGLPMLEHRLVTTQGDSGLALRHVLKFIGGQLLYVTPPFLVASYWLGRDLFRQRAHAVTASILWWAFLLPLCFLLPLSLWSARAEPHWVAPALLPLGVQVARSQVISRRLARVCLLTGGVFTLFVWLSVKTTLFIELSKSTVGQLFGGYRARYDLTNDLYAWGPAKGLLRQAVADVTEKTGSMPTVVGAPHWMICAQAQVAVGPQVPVGCFSALPSDFDNWLPPAIWRSSHTLLVVQDSRYPVDVAREFPERENIGVWRTTVNRGQHAVRTLHITGLRRNVGTARRTR